MEQIEMRLIDANRIIQVADHAYNEWNLAMATQDTNRGVNKVLRKQELCKVVRAVAEDCPTIDPETLPIVKELKEALQKATEEKNEAIKRAQAAECAASDLCDDFTDFVTGGIHNAAPYCANRRPECVNGRGWCTGDNRVCRGFLPKAALPEEKDK